VRAIIFGGVNGAGKTTFARDLLRLESEDIEYLNADEIKRASSAPISDIEAGRKLLAHLRTCVNARRSFALETTLASTGYARAAKGWTAAGYRLVLHYIELPSADYAIERVRRRVAHGGHGVPEATIRRRFARSRPLFDTVYRPLADMWYHYASDEHGLRLVHEGSR
jgi:predicted ABC-type ATPase